MGKRFTYKDSRQNYPGPGNYIRFSEFGILVPKRQKSQGRAVTEGNSAGKEANNAEESGGENKKEAGRENAKETEVQPAKTDA